MSKNMVQFQRGMSLTDFFAEYGTEARCERALFAWRWPNGFICPECGYRGFCALSARKLFQCHRCHHQTSLTSETLFAATKLPLTTWFLAMYLLTQSKNAISALELKRQLGISYNSAWLLKHKLMQSMKERDDTQPLAGLIQLDDAYWGGERRGGKRGRGAPGKSPFVVAVQTTAEGRPHALRMSRVATFSSAELKRWAAKHVHPSCLVVSDGLACFRAVTEAQCQHQPIVTGGGPDSVAIEAFTWVNTVLGNVKRSLNGTYHAVGAKHLPRYLAEFCYRFNRRYNLAEMLPRLGFAAARTPPMPYRLVKLAEAHW